MPRITKACKDNKEAIVLNALITQPSVPKVAKATGIDPKAIYRMLDNADFMARLTEARAKATEEAISYLQGNLTICADELMNIVNDKENSPQVRISAINSVFNNYRLLKTENEKVTTGVAVNIIDSI